MAHSTTIRGGVSELIASSLLFTEFGWEVSRPLIPETYDLLARDPESGEYHRIQIKTVRRRADRDNQPVVYATKNSGDPYTTDEIDWIMGVEGNKAYIFKCRNKKEYWLNETDLHKAATQYQLLGA